MEGTRRLWPAAVVASVALHGAVLVGFGLLGGRTVVQARPAPELSEAVLSLLEEDAGQTQIFNGPPPGQPQERTEGAVETPTPKAETIETLPALLVDPLYQGSAAVPEGVGALMTRKPVREITRAGRPPSSACPRTASASST